MRGSFTGAIRERFGRFQLADGDTLFLYEVGEIPLALQSKLLRVLQEGEYERVGDEVTRSVNVRVLSATNPPGSLYRLGVFPVEMPPLRERREDVQKWPRILCGKPASDFTYPSLDSLSAS